MANDNISYSERQQAIGTALASDPLVAVFQVTTHDGKNTIEQDAANKVAAMYAGGVKNFEFLLRGDNTMPLHTHSPRGKEQGATLDQTYVGQVLKAIDQLAEKYKDKGVTFGVGTISNHKMMQDVIDNKNISFAMTAHWPGMGKHSIVKEAILGELPGLFTASKMENVVVEPKGNGELLNVDQPGKDTLNPAAIAELRNAGLDLFKASDFTKIALKCANGSKWEAAAQVKDDKGEPTPDAALTKVSLGLIAIAEATRDSYPDKTVPAKEKFIVATTGGVDLSTLPYLATGTKNPQVRSRIEAILGKDPSTQVLLNILDRTTFGAGGTFMTKDYDKLFAAGKTAEAMESLTTMATKAVDDIRAAKAAVADQFRSVA